MFDVVTMINKYLLFSAFTLTMLPTVTLAMDQLFLKNGDRFSGRIQEYHTGAVSIETNYGVFNVPLNQVSGVQSDDEVLQKEVAKMMAEPTLTAPAQAIVAEVPASQDVPIVADVVEEQDGVKQAGLFGAAWTGEVTADGFLTSGNDDDKEFEAGLSTEARWDKHRVQYDGEFGFEKEDGEKKEIAWSNNLAHDYFFAEKWFWDTRIGFEKDDEDELDLRSKIFTGPGYQAYDRDDLSLAFTLGLGYQKEDFSTRGAEDSMATEWTMDYEQSFYDDAFSVFHENDFIVPFDDTNDFLLESSTGVEAPIAGGVFARAGVNFDWDNDPVVDRVEEDTEYFLSLGYEW